MGACISSSTDNSTSAFVVTNKGELFEYPTPIFVSEVLQFEKPSFFLCNSDTLYCDQRIQSLDQEQQLDAGQIYFILPKTMLRRRLTTTDMAALANKASHALDSHYSHKRNKNKARISPLETSQVNDEEGMHKQKPNNGGLKVSRSRSIRKYSSKKARVSSLRLSTIYENEDCDH